MGAGGDGGGGGGDGERVAAGRRGRIFSGRDSFHGGNFSGRGSFRGWGRGQFSGEGAQFSGTVFLEPCFDFFYLLN